MHRTRQLCPPTLLAAAWLLIIAAGCEDPSSPAITPIIDLDIQPKTTEVWEGDTMTFTVSASRHLPDGTVFRWTIGSERVVEGTDVSVTHVFDRVGKAVVYVTVVESPLTRVTFNPASVSIMVRQVTNKLSINTESKLWDAGYDLRMSTSWGNRLPGDFSIRWDFGDGVRTEVDDDTSCTHRYATPGTYRISAELYDPVRGVVLGSATATVEITAPTPGRFLHIAFRRGAFLYSIYNNDWRTESIVDTLVWHCDSTLRWEGDRFHFSYVRRLSSMYGISSRELIVEGSLKAGRLADLTFRSTSRSSGFLQGSDSSMQFLKVADVPEGPAGPGEYVVHGYAQVFPAVWTIQEYMGFSSRSYMSTTSYRRILVNLNFPPDIELRITFSHRRSAP
jgi:hypothetical protein